MFAIGKNLIIKEDEKFIKGECETAVFRRRECETAVIARRECETIVIGRLIIMYLIHETTDYHKIEV